MTIKQKKETVRESCGPPNGENSGVREAKERLLTEGEVES